MRLRSSACSNAFLFLIMLASYCTSSAFFFNRGCCPREYVCGPEPLLCGAFGLQLHGGVYPIIWHQREAVFQNNCPAGSLFNIGQLPKFKHLYRTPWTVGIQASYALSCNHDVFLEFNYAQAKNKTVGTNLSCSDCGIVSAPNPNLSLVLNKYKLFSGYVGARYYWDRWCDQAALFVGGKVGVVHHKHVNFSQLTAATVITGYTRPRFFASNTVLSGGVQLGLDYCVCGGWSVMLTAEAVFNCGPHAEHLIILQSPDAGSLLAQNLLLGGVRSEIAFPVTVGVKYNF